MREFTFSMLPWNVVFGAGTLASLPDRLDNLGLSRAIILSTPEQATQTQQVAALLGGRAVGMFTEARMHVPIAVAEAAAEQAKQTGADCSVTIGGGSTTGLGKALALDLGLP